jgi:hypothetical protein
MSKNKVFDFSQNFEKIFCDNLDANTMNRQSKKFGPKSQIRKDIIGVMT